jgi:LAO/AO transport system kinase
MMETINEQLKNNFHNHPDIIQLLATNQQEVLLNKISPFAAAQNLLMHYFKKQ